MRTEILVVALFAVLPAHAGDVYVSKDANGNIVYTDTPQSIPAQKVGVASTPADDAASQQRYQAEMQQLKEQQQSAAAAQSKQATTTQAAKLSADDLAKRCADARQHYQTVMESRRLYSEGPNGERVYLDSDQIDATRASAKQVMDQMCSAQQ
ncbi:MAG: DUF4124 domain-containing protein [Steroidobacteraceae bacterium]